MVFEEVRFEGFGTRREAEEYIQTVGCYAVAVGHSPGIYMDVAYAKCQTDGLPGYLMQQFTTYDKTQKYTMTAAATIRMSKA